MFPDGSKDQRGDKDKDIRIARMLLSVSLSGSEKTTLPLLTLMNM
jgi:hypothetical protein